MRLQLESVSLARPGFTLRADITLAGPVSCLSGPSGSGKTTLLEIIAGLRRPDQGRIVLGDEVVADTGGGRHTPPERRGIGYVPQDLALFPHLTAGENLLFGCPRGVTGAMRPERVVEVLEIGGLLQRGVGRLSGGERQRLAIGRALLAQPRLLLLDEPLTGLDDDLKGRVLGHLQSVIREFRVPVVYVSHSRAELAELRGETFVLREGEVRRVAG